MGRNQLDGVWSIAIGLPAADAAPQMAEAKMAHHRQKHLPPYCHHHRSSCSSSSSSCSIVPLLLLSNHGRPPITARDTDLVRVPPRSRTAALTAPYPSSNSGSAGLRPSRQPPLLQPFTASARLGDSLYLVSLGRPALWYKSACTGQSSWPT